MGQNKFDAIVIGSGVSGGMAAKELTEKGLTVLMLERGRNIVHVKDYINANKNPWDFQHRGKELSHGSLPDGEKNLFNLSSNMADAPYTQIKKFDWFRAYNVGGKSLLWGRQSYRWSDFDFEANGKEGIAVDWPIRYKDLAPWYSHVEKFVGISGSAEGLSQLPDGDFLPAMEMNCVEKEVATRINKFYEAKRTMIIGRVANITKDLEGRTRCQSRDKCSLGCPFGAYFSTQSSTLPAAMKTGRLTLRPWSIVTQIIYDKEIKKATGVEIVDAESNQTYRFDAKIIFVCASTLNSTWILMNSATDIWPDGLGSSSGELGHNLMDHHMGIGVGGTFEGFEDRYYFGRRPNGVYIPRYRNLFGDKRDYLRGFGFQGMASRHGWDRDIAEFSVGKELKDELTEPGKWTFGMGPFGEMLPDYENKVTLDKIKKDHWGLPVLSIDCELKENEKRMHKEMLSDSAELLEAAGLKNVKAAEYHTAPGRAIHEMGTARMGKEAKTSVLNGFNQIWDSKNVFVTDGACMTSSACQNPSLTFMALTARAADHAVSELKKNNL